MQALQYQFSNLAPELSVKVFEDHWQLYEGYVERLNKTMQELSNPYDVNLQRSAGPTSGRMRDAIMDKTYLTNAVILHEMFFENVILPKNSPPMVPGPTFISLVQQHFPNVKAADFWSHVVKPIAKSARGWCIIGWNTLQGTMDVSMMDDHGGPLSLGIYPFLVIDVYEHAYAAQYSVDRGTYLEHIYRSINWNVVEHRVARMHSASELMRTSVPDEAEEYIRKLNDDSQDDGFGFPGEEYFPDGDAPASKGLDNRQELSVQNNPRGVQSSVQSAVVTKADVEESFDRVVHLARVTFTDTDDTFDKEAKGKSPEFRDALWARLQEENE